MRRRGWRKVADDWKATAEKWEESSTKWEATAKAWREAAERWQAVAEGRPILGTQTDREWLIQHQGRNNPLVSFPAAQRLHGDTEAEK